MNSGLPFLIDAIFGKKDLASVSLEEMYEVINEFPSFNAGHFLLSKKLKEQNNPEYEKESMRTALYFHNAFWLQSLLDGENNVWKEEKPISFKITHEDELFTERPGFEKIEPVEKFNIDKVPFPEDELDKETEEILSQEKEEQSPKVNIENIEFSKQENEIVSRVMSFDDLVLKYKIDNIEPFGETLTDSDNETFPVSPPESTDVKVHESIESTVIETNLESSPEPPFEHKNEPSAGLNSESIQIPFADSEYGQLETLEEIVNEYGIFEEVVVRKPDLDTEAFDRPIEIIPAISESLPAEMPEEKNGTSVSEILSEEDETIVENKINENLLIKPEEYDYEAFDGPADLADEGENLNEFAETQTEESLFPINGIEEQKPVSSFNAKNAESIVFTPYHMIDYFASQGIKLVLEDQPSDILGKQLKSFTDWLKIMKKLPAKSLPDNSDEKESERIRHFAAHSIEERDILTESMAEVLAKQGMYENAIALFQKLSLIYPPKSAYFASRIEQLKASLP